MRVTLSLVQHPGTQEGGRKVEGYAILQAEVHAGDATGVTVFTLGTIRAVEEAGEAGKLMPYALSALITDNSTVLADWMLEIE